MRKMTSFWKVAKLAKSQFWAKIKNDTTMWKATKLTLELFYTEKTPKKRLLYTKNDKFLKSGYWKLATLQRL